jgi:hypothetical protein
MTYDLEIYQLANILLRKYGASAPLIAAQRAEAEKAKGDVLAELAWKAVLRAVQECVRTEREPGELVN